MPIKQIYKIMAVVQKIYSPAFLTNQYAHIIFAYARNGCGGPADLSANDKQTENPTFICAVKPSSTDGFRIEEKGMQIDIRKLTSDDLEEFGTVSMACTSHSRLRVEWMDQGIGGIRLTEEPLPKPYSQ
jgi:hypothetical protein